MRATALLLLVVTVLGACNGERQPMPKTVQGREALPPVKAQGQPQQAPPAATPVQR